MQLLVNCCGIKVIKHFHTEVFYTEYILLVSVAISPVISIISLISPVHEHRRKFQTVWCLG